MANTQHFQDIKNLLHHFSNEGKKGLLKVRIIRFIFELKEVSVAQICDEFNLSIPSVTKLLQELTSEGWIEKKGEGESRGGRKPVLLGLVSNLFYVLCIDIALYEVKIALFDNTLQMEAKTSFPFQLSKTRENTDLIKQKADELLAETGINNKQLIGVSICMPGLVSEQKGESHFYLKDPNSHLSLAHYFESMFSLPAIIQNDVNAAAEGELQRGKAKGIKDALVLLMDWGLGLGIIMDGKVRKGAAGFSGEIGHIPFDYNGELCYCGKQGCLETVASGNALIRLAKEGVRAGQHSILLELCKGDIDQIDPQMITLAGNKGDLFAIKLLSQVGSAIGKGISTLIQIFNPALIILEGKMAAAEQYLTLPMLQSINTYCMTQIREHTNIAVSELKEEANLIGCAVEGIEQFLIAETY